MIPGFEDALRAVYRERPCEVLPNALWKTLRTVDEGGFSTAYAEDLQRNLIDSVQAIDERRLLVYWNRDGEPPGLDKERIERLELVLLHQRYASGFPVDSFPSASRSFRLVHRGTAGEVRLLDRFRFQQVDVAREAEAVAALIRRCYEGSAMTAETVRGWLDHPVYAPDLWVWVVDTGTDVPAGLGIAELDKSVPEASLEWIQVLPAYRRRGLGVALVRELLRRVEGRVSFTTAAGWVDNVTNPEGLYRRCGFEGQDLWWVLRRNAAQP